MKRMFIVSQASEVMESVAKRIKIDSDNKMVCITTSIERKDPKSLGWFEKDRQSLVDAGFEVTDYTITGKNLGQLRDDLNGYKYLYVSGGDVAWLIEQAYKSGFADLVKILVEEKGVIYIGSSAGGIVCGPTIPAYYEVNREYFSEDKVKGFDLVNFTSIPHWGREDYYDKYINKRLAQVFSQEHNPYMIINDYQYVVVEDDNYRLADVRKENHV